MVSLEPFIIPEHANPIIASRRRRIKIHLFIAYRITLSVEVCKFKCVCVFREFTFVSAEALIYVYPWRGAKVWVFIWLQQDHIHT